ncbi:hypothetical protein YC2023_057303 [Brassica napus]
MEEEEESKEKMRERVEEIASDTVEGGGPELGFSYRRFSGHLESYTIWMHIYVVNKHVVLVALRGSAPTQPVDNSLSRTFLRRKLNSPIFHIFPLSISFLSIKATHLIAFLQPPFFVSSIFLDFSSIHSSSAFPVNSPRILISVPH